MENTHTQPCLIRENTKYLRDKLIELGYTSNISNKDTDTILYCSDNTFYTRDAPCRNYIKCNHNKTLFIELASKN